MTLVMEDMLAPSSSLTSLTPCVTLPIVLISADIRTIGRVTQGVKLVKLDDGASISSITRVISEDATPTKPVEQNGDGENTSNEESIDEK